jgi:hypothetical protein
MPASCALFRALIRRLSESAATAASSALLERIRDRRSDAMALLVPPAGEQPKTGKKRREGR